MGKINKLIRLSLVTLVAVSGLTALQSVFLSPPEVSATAPYVACSPEQTRAMQRWWFFGDRGMIDFGASGTDMTVSQNPTDFDTSEGTTVVTDTSGQLLFYSDGQTVFNKNGQVMTNGSGLIAAPSATQTVAAFPSLTQAGIYFVVSNGGAFEEDGIGPLRYSKVDMSLNGGLGGVVPSEKNILIADGADIATEGLIAVPNSSGTGFWVITATGGDQVGNHNIVSVEFDGNGPTGTIVESPMSTPNGDTFASFSLSPDMKTLAQHFGFRDDTVGQLRLLDINGTTGEMTERITWNTPSNATGNGGYNYGVDFSPDGNWLYATRIFSGGKLYRYDISTHTTAQDLEDNMEVVGNIGTSGGQVTRAPNGKMYVANQNTGFLSVVNDPNNSTDPGFVSNGLPLTAGSKSQYGLPQMATGCPAQLIAPSNVIATAESYDKINLTWSAPISNDGNTLLGYKIERSSDNASWATVTANTNSPSTLTYQDTGLASETRYYYRISAVFDEVTSDPSTAANAKTGIHVPDCSEDFADCMTSDITGEDILLHVDDSCTVQSASLTASSSIAAKDGDYSYPHGLLDFTLDCVTAGYTTTVTQYYFGLTDSQYELRKYNGITGQYSAVQNYTIENVTVDDRSALRVIYMVKDGGELDEDGIENGIIKDPVGLGVLMAEDELVETGQAQTIYSTITAISIVAMALVVQYPAPRAMNLINKMFIRE